MYVEIKVDDLTPDVAAACARSGKTLDEVSADNLCYGMVRVLDDWEEQLVYVMLGLDGGRSLSFALSRHAALAMAHALAGAARELRGP
jgi:hypothetical protein